MNDWTETLNAITNLVTALATCGTLLVACCALHTWRKEFIGKKKIELAAEIMVRVLEFQDILIQARISIHTPQEIDEIKKWLDEVNYKKRHVSDSVAWPIYPDKLRYLTPIHRLNKNANITEGFEEIFDKSLIYFSEDLCKLLVELHSFLGKIRCASEMLYENPDNIESQQIAFSNMKANDPVSKRIFEIGEEIKLNLEPLYQDKQTPWKKMKKTGVDSV